MYNLLSVSKIIKTIFLSIANLYNHYQQIRHFLLIISGSLNWPWSTKILGQFVTRMCKFISQSDVKHIMTSPIKTIMSVLKTDIITSITAHSIGLTEILEIKSVSTFKTDVILYLLEIIVLFKYSKSSPPYI